jgi:hypothetical protein
VSSRSHVGFWLLLCLCAVFVVPYFVRGDAMRSRLVQEVSAVKLTFGARAGNGIVETVNDVYQATVVASGLREALDDLKHTQRDEEVAQRIGTKVLVKAAKGIDGYIQALSRIVVVAFWMLVLLPFAAAVLIDGFSARAKKFETLGFQNPTAFAAGVHLVVLVSAVPLLYVVAPFSVSPLFMPYWAAATALPLSFAIQHMQPVLTR